MNCCDSRDLHFGTKHAARDLARYQKHGPDWTTGKMIEAIRQSAQPGGSLLDVGAGIGVIQCELLDSFCSQATHIDLSSAYIEAAKRESSRRGLSDRISHIHGDLALSGDLVASSDIVSLDRVICCYPDYRGILSVAAKKCKAILVMSYPRNHWLGRMAFVLDNLKRKLSGDPFRAYVHDPTAVQSVPKAYGLDMARVMKTFFWRVELYTRQP